MYNEDTEFVRSSPKDQDLRPADTEGKITIDKFDVQRAYYTGNLFGASFLLGFSGELVGVDGLACVPICDDGDSTGAQNTTWNTVHEVGAEAGLTDGPGDASQNEDEADNDGRAQDTGVALHVRNAPGVIQDNTNAWQMNGWAIPFPTERFVGQLVDDEGNTITDDQLEDRVTTLVDEGILTKGTTPQICGYTPDINFRSTGEQSFCDSPMLYIGDKEDNSDGLRFDDYGEQCGSPAYVCGPSNGAYWESAAVGLAAYGGQDQDDHIRWHWVVAPNQQECGFTQPGFDFESDGAKKPYLAHDLDVYTPVQDLNNAPHTSIDGTQAYASALSTEGTDVLFDALDQVPDLPGGVDDAVNDTADAVDEATASVTTDSVLEPNHVGAEDTTIDDDSQQRVDEERSVTEDPCQQLDADESPVTVDPWVNLLDAGVEDTRDQNVVLAPTDDPLAGTSTVADGIGLYETDDDSVDDDNDRTTDRYVTDGFTGVFTDKNDDGEYDRILGFGDATDGFGSPVYKPDDVQSVGAYPMLWDMEINVENGQPVVDENAGCSLSDFPFSKAMKDAGYGPSTGLAQAIYLEEPTVFQEASSPSNAAPYDGGQIFVLLSQSPRTQWDGDISQTDSDLPLDGEVDRLVRELIDYLEAEHGITVTADDVEEPGAELGLDSDYESQCGESTGGFTSAVSFTHTCESGCAGDTIATAYSFEVADDPLGGGEIPSLTIEGSAHEFGLGQQTWHDIDAFDGDPDRNEQRESPPPTGD
ncbi:hypothetical protein BRD56_11530 [Thermoplasmatales archaeon SW_10_69_26]|nr:MAG: hypothetical protein BRD56_11530 [Thermoplasmatales archaeon SW_10_69_26]